MAIANPFVDIFGEVLRAPKGSICLIGVAIMWDNENHLSLPPSHKGGQQQCDKMGRLFLTFGLLQH